MTFHERSSSPLDELHSHRVQRRCRRPRWSVEHRGPRGSRLSPVRMGSRWSEPSTRQSTFGMPTRRGASLDASIAPALMKLRMRRRFTKKNRCHRRMDDSGRRSRAGTCRRRRGTSGCGARRAAAPPTEIGCQVDVDAFERRAPRRDHGRARQDRVVDCRDVGAGLARRGKELHAPIAGHRRLDRRRHRVVHRRSAVDEDRAAILAPRYGGVERAGRLDELPRVWRRVMARQLRARAAGRRCAASLAMASRSPVSSRPATISANR